MGKGVAVPYIVALVIGLIVVVIMVYLIYRFVLGEKWHAEECRARFIDWCTMCKNIGWSDSDKLTIPQKLRDDCADVISKHFGFFITSGQNDHCDTEKTKKDCCTVGVKNEVCQ